MKKVFMCIIGAITLSIILPGLFQQSSKISEQGIILDYFVLISVKYDNKNSEDHEDIVENYETVNEVIALAHDFEDAEDQRPHIEGVPLDEQLLDYIWNKSNEYDFAYTFVLAIIGVESDYGRATLNVNKNGTVDSGIAQINSNNVDWLSELAAIENVDVYNDYHSVDMMFELLRYERDFFRGLGYSEEDVFFLTCMAYNRGRGGTLNYIKKHGLVENRYVQKVLEHKERLENKIYNLGEDDVTHVYHSH